MTRIFYLLFRFLEILLVGFVASIMIVMSGGVFFLAVSGGASIEKIALSALIGAFMSLVAAWIFFRRVKVSGRDEIYAQTGFDLSEGGYVAFVFVTVVILLGLAAWFFIDDERFPKTPPDEVGATIATPEAPTD